MEPVQPGDVLCVRGPDRSWWDRWVGRLIRLGAALRDEPNLDSHVVIAHHTDAAGTHWGIEGRPGGVGWVDLAVYDGPYVVTNATQPKTPDQRAAVCAAAVGLLGTGYDWAAIGMDTLDALHLDALWRDHTWGDQPPAHVVCSALATWVYQHVGLASPRVPWRTSTPGEWTAWILEKGWAK